MADSDGLKKRGGEKDAAKKELSVIVPTYNETENLRPLAERLFATMKTAGITAELLIVDDESPGSDDSKRIAEELASEGYKVRIHCRKKVEGRGLSSAVLLGFDKAVYENVLCMDADLQHEPESVPDVAGPVLDGTAEFTVGSRNVAGGGVGFEWSAFRRIVSSGATLLAWPVASSTDPMSGFFCTSKTVLKRGKGRFNLKGFKIGLEVMARCRCKPVKDIPITFRDRAAGESKLSASQYRFYVEQLLSLYFDRYGLLLLMLLLALLVFAVQLGSHAGQYLKVKDS